MATIRLSTASSFLAAAIAHLQVVANAMETVVPPSTRVRNFADTRPVKLEELEHVIASLAIETARPQMGEMAREIAATLIGLGTEVWGGMRLYSATNMGEGGLRLPGALRMVKQLSCCRITPIPCWRRPRSRQGSAWACMRRTPTHRRRP